MSLIRIEPIALDTAGWILGVRSLVELLHDTIPEAEHREREALRGRAQGEGWDAGEYFVELQQVELRFQAWLPRLTGYSVIILMHSLVERQLLAVAKQLQQRHGYKLGVKEIQGSPIERAKTYLTKVAGIDIVSDLGWKELTNLQDLRNIVAHRLGKPGETARDQEGINRLLECYRGNLVLEKRPDSFEPEVEVSRSLCEHFIDQVAGFFKRLLVKAEILEGGDWFPG
jgi:hypothetical protein